MSMLERLNEQSQGFQNMQDEAENRINNFDIEHQMWTGATAAYRLGHEQLGMNINNELMRSAHTLLPTLFKTGKALSQRASGMPTTLAEAQRRAAAATGDAASTASEAVARLPGGQAIDAATRFAGQTPTTVQEIGTRNLTTQALPEPRADIPTSSLARNAEASLDASGRQFKPTVLRDIDTTAPALKNNLPQPRDSSSTPAPTAESNSPAYTPLAETETPERQALGRRMAENLSDASSRTRNNLTGKSGQAYEFNKGRAPEGDRAPGYKNPHLLDDEGGFGDDMATKGFLRNPIGDADIIQKYQNLAGNDTSRVGELAASGIPKAPAARVTDPVNYPNLPAEDAPAPAAPQGPPINYGLDGAQPGGVDGTGGIPGVNWDGQTSTGQTEVPLKDEGAPGGPPSSTRAAGAPDGAAPDGPAADRPAAPEAPDGAEGAGEPAVTEPAAPAEPPAAPPAAPEEPNVDPLAAVENIDAETQVADAIPGVGELIGGIMDAVTAGMAVGEALRSATDSAPTQPTAPHALSTAFDSSPVINSSDYHNA